MPVGPAITPGTDGQQRSPLLTGVTEDGRRIGLSPDGIPELLNSIVRGDPETGEVHIVAPDQPTLDELATRSKVSSRCLRNRLERDPRINRLAFDWPAVGARDETVAGHAGGRCRLPWPHVARGPG